MVMFKDHEPQLAGPTMPRAITVTKAKGAQLGVILTETTRLASLTGANNADGRMIASVKCLRFDKVTDESPIFGLVHVGDFLLQINATVVSSYPKAAKQLKDLQSCTLIILSADEDRLLRTAGKDRRLQTSFMELNGEYQANYGDGKYPSLDATGVDVNVGFI